MRGIIPVLLTAILIPMGAGAKPLNARRNVKPAYCYYDSNHLTWKIGNDVLEAVIHFDKLSNSLKPVLLHDKHSPLQALSPVAGGAIIRMTPGDRTLTLNKDWAFSWQMVEDPSNGGRILTVHLEGIASNDGWAIEEKYEVGPGSSPWLANYFTLINHSERNATINEITFSGWRLVPSRKLGLEPNTSALYISDSGLIQQATFSMSKMIACKIDPAKEISGHGGRYYSPCAILTLTNKGKNANLSMTRKINELAEGE